ncbi:MAG: hypothetical protein ABIH66_12115 [bacterium]
MDIPFSLNPLSRLGIGVQNTVRKAVGDAPFDTSALRVDIPDGRAAARIREGVHALARAVSFPFGYRLRTRWAPAAKGGRTSTRSLDAILASLAVRYYNPALALDIVRPFFLNQTIEGMIPNAVSPMSISLHHASPLILMPVIQSHVIAPDPETLKYCYNRALKFSDWLAVRKKRDDGFFYPAGGEDLRAFRAFGPGLRPGAGLEDTIHVGMNCVQIILYRELSRAALLLESPREARKFRARARKLSRLLLDRAWDPERGDLFNVVGEKRADEPSPVGFLALPAEVVSRQQAKALMESALKNPRLPQPRDTGHAMMLFLLLAGMEKYGFRAEAGALAHEALKNITGTAAAEAPRDNFFIAAAALPLLLQHIVGYHPFRDRVVLAPALPEAWKGRAVTVRDRIIDRNVSLTLLEGNRVKCQLRAIGCAAGRADVETEIENHKFRNFVFEEPKKD